MTTVKVVVLNREGKKTRRKRGEREIVFLRDQIQQQKKTSQQVESSADVCSVLSSRHVPQPPCYEEDLKKKKCFSAKIRNPWRVAARTDRRAKREWGRTDCCHAEDGRNREEEEKSFIVVSFDASWDGKSNINESTHWLLRGV
jgi:hypothetical protein